MIDWQSFSRSLVKELRTPALVVDLDAFERNIRRLARHCDEQSIALRPHAKTHKCVEIARRQMAAGAIGQCCATLDEAAALVEGGIASILLTSPITADVSIRDLVNLNMRCPDLMAVVDNQEMVDRFSQAALSAGQKIKLLVDIDIGHHRTGIAPLAPAGELAKQISNSPALEFRGIQGYAGHLMHLADRTQRHRCCVEALAHLGRTRDMLTEMGMPPLIVSGGGTGSFDIDPQQKVLTELQAGSYIFMDRQYNQVWAEENGPPFETSLFVLSRIVSANQRGFVTTDAGLKALSTDAGVPEIAFGAETGPGYCFFGDEYGRVAVKDGHQIKNGTAIALIVPHCDPTVNLYGHYVVVRGEEIIGFWPIAGGKYRSFAN